MSKAFFIPREYTMKHFRLEDKINCYFMMRVLLIFVLLKVVYASVCVYFGLGCFLSVSNTNERWNNKITAFFL